jgi:hypothetical protein
VVWPTPTGLGSTIKYAYEVISPETAALLIANEANVAAIDISRIDTIRVVDNFFKFNFFLSP